MGYSNYVTIWENNLKAIHSDGCNATTKSEEEEINGKEDPEGNEEDIAEV